MKFPTDGNELKQIQNGFYKVADLPGIFGAIDGTHVKIQAPSGDQEPHYINRKGYHSNLQTVCDFDGKFLNIVHRTFYCFNNQEEIWDPNTQTAAET